MMSYNYICWFIYPTRGRFGNVYRCEEKKTGRSFAAKFIKVKSSERDETRQEVAIMNQLHHPKLLLLWDAFEAPREMVLVMEQWVLKLMVDIVIISLMVPYWNGTILYIRLNPVFVPLHVSESALDFWYSLENWIVLVQPHRSSS